MNGISSITIIQYVIVLLLIIFLIYIIRFNHSLRLSKRISKYSIDPLNDKQTSLFDKFYLIYIWMRNNISKSLSKYNSIVKYSLKYYKYSDNLDNTKPIEIVSNKILVSFLFFLINLLANTLVIRTTGVMGIVIALVIGFYVPDIYYSYLNYMRRKRIERDLLNAIIMLNNAFKSGKSTMQAIEIVKDELHGPIKDEFKRMHTEISYGLSLEEVFQRFAKRVNVEEINYIASSLTILNRTGGNIVKVFTSIEKSMFSKRKLESELRALTASSRTMIKVLLFLPFVFVGIIFILNPTYFNPFFDNFAGLSMFLVIVLFYCMYAYFVQKVLRVRL